MTKAALHPLPMCFLLFYSFHPSPWSNSHSSLLTWGTGDREMPRKLKLPSLRHHCLQACPRFVRWTQNNHNFHSNKQCRTKPASFLLRWHKTSPKPQTEKHLAHGSHVLQDLSCCVNDNEHLFSLRQTITLWHRLPGKAPVRFFPKGPEAKTVLSCWTWWSHSEKPCGVWT